VLRPGAAADDAALDAHCRDRIAGYKRPRRYQFMEVLPRVPSTNKVDKRALRAPFWQGQGRQVS
jgi:acyl-CoA synthetase (AMP-forming)/AMP-acid ligase II